MPIEAIGRKAGTPLTEFSMIISRCSHYSDIVMTAVLSGREQVIRTLPLEAGIRTIRISAVSTIFMGATPSWVALFRISWRQSSKLIRIVLVCALDENGTESNSAEKIRTFNIFIDFSFCTLASHRVQKFGRCKALFNPRSAIIPWLCMLSCLYIWARPKVTISSRRCDAFLDARTSRDAGSDGT